MPLYRYRAVQGSGEIRKGYLSAANENELAFFLRDSGLELIDAKSHGGPVSARTHAKQRVRIQTERLVLLCTQLKDLMRAGLPFPKALQGLIGTQPPGTLRDKLDDIAKSVNNGRSVADAFAEHEDLFGPIFLALLKTGEHSGDLGTTFAHLAKHLDRQAKLARHLKRALRYPAFLLAVALGVITFMLLAVVPHVVDFLNSIDSDLPLATKALLKASSLFADFWLLALAGAGAVALGIAALRRSSKTFALHTDDWLLALPGLGPTLHRLALARFSHALALLLDSGADVPTSLTTASAVLGNRALAAEAESAADKVRSGQSLSSASATLFPALVIQMLGVGEQTGSLSRVLNDVARIYDDEAEAGLDRFIGALEPLLTLLIGAILAWIVLAVLGPVYGNLGKLTATGGA